MNTIYDKLAIGERIRRKRILLGFTQDETAERINRATKYYADIERGSCGMSVTTLIAVSETLDMSMDYIILGKTSNDDALLSIQETDSTGSRLTSTNDKIKKYAIQLIKLLQGLEEYL